MKKRMLFTLAMVAMSGAAQAQQSEQAEKAQFEAQLNTAIANIRKQAQAAQDALNKAGEYTYVYALLSDSFWNISWYGLKLRNLLSAQETQLKDVKDAMVELKKLMQDTQQTLNARQDKLFGNQLVVADQVAEIFKRIQVEVQNAKDLLVAKGLL